MKKPSILFLAHSQSPHTKKWVEHFIRNGWQVYIISFQSEKLKGAINFYLNVGKINTDGGNFKYLLKLFHLIYLIWKIKPDVLNCHYLSSYGILGYLSYYKNLTITLYGTDILLYAKKNQLYSFLTKKVFKKATLIFSVSDGMSKFIIDQFKIDKNKLITKQYGIDLSVFNCPAKNILRKYTFITNRSFVENSNYKLILNSLQILKHDNLNFEMLIVGSGPLKLKIKSMIDDFDLGMSVILMDKVNHRQMADLLRDSMIYISMTSSDGTPLSVFEAAACGAFPVLSEIDPNLEWIRKGLKGKCVPLTNPDILAKTLSETIIQLEKYDYKQQNFDFVNKEMDYNKNMSYIEDKFIEFINTPK